MSELVRRLERRIAAVGLPGRALGTMLVVVFLAFGVLLGRLTRPKAAPARQTVEVQTPVASVAQTTTRPAESTPTPAATEGEDTEGKAEGKEKESEEGEDQEEGTGKDGSAKEQAGSNRAPSGGEPAKDGEAKSKAAGKGAGGKAGKAALPAIRHVFVVVLGDAAYAEAFGPEAKGRYLAKTLERQGKLLERFYAVAHQQLPDAIALISGQGPTRATAEDCPVYEQIAPGTPTTDGQISGQGCIYPRSVQTIAGQLEAKRLTWRAYIQQLGGSEPSAGCAHPALGAADPTAGLGISASTTTSTTTTTTTTASAASGSLAAAGSITTAGATAAAGESPYATFTDPFVYFDSIIDSKACAADVVGLRPLAHDLASAAGTPNLSYIVPDLCQDGTATPCAAGSPDGMPAAEGFLKKIVPEILAAPDYKQNGLLVITTAEAPTTGEYADSSSCCGQPHFPNLPPPAGSLSSAPGGGEVGALLLSPFIKGGSISQETYNDFSLLATIEQIFKVKPLGYAGLKEAKPFAASLFSG